MDKAVVLYGKVGEECYGKIMWRDGEKLISVRIEKCWDKRCCNELSVRGVVEECTKEIV